MTPPVMRTATSIKPPAQSAMLPLVSVASRVNRRRVASRFAAPFIDASGVVNCAKCLEALL
jgi:hypothetical protein